MPIGLVIVHWDERMGPEILAAYPDGTGISEETITELYTQHEFCGNKGLITLHSGEDHIASYYSGEDQGLYLMLRLDPEEEGEIFEEGLAEAINQIDTNLNAMIPQIFERLTAYATYNEEQRLALTWQNEVKMNILKILREGAIQKIELATWLKDQYKDIKTDVDAILGSLTKIGMIHLASVNGFSSELVFLTEDIRIFRAPPSKSVQNSINHYLPSSLKKVYLQKTRDYFQYHRPDLDNPQETQKIIQQIILNPMNYEILCQLRQNIMTRNDLERILKKGVSQIDLAMNSFIENELVTALMDKNGQLYYCLMSDFQIEKFYPEYLMDVIAAQYRTQAQNSRILMKSLEILHDEFESNQKRAKEPVKTRKQVKSSQKKHQTDAEIELEKDISINA
jgi:hypothetical protein